MEFNTCKICVLSLCVISFVYYNAALSEVNCDSGWFGPKCQYKCQCLDGCYNTGLCKSEKCLSGWFGFKCQYKNIISSISFSNPHDSISSSVWQDSDDSTCVTSESVKAVVVTLTHKAPFFFMRLVVSNAAKLDRFTVSFDDNIIAYKRIDCKRQRFTSINSRTVDIRCDVDETVQRVILHGEGVMSLCSIYVSAGRNMALKQTVDQTLTGTATYAEEAVDGYNYGGSCIFNGSDTGISPNWTLVLREPVIAGNFEIYIGGKRRLNWSFYRSRLETFDVNNSLVSNFSLLWDFTTQIFFSNTDQTPIKKVTSISTRGILPICEVYLFGECLPGKWDLDCQLNCDNKCPDFCSESDGSCPTGCLGYYPPNCLIECPPDKWGVNCREVCSDRCQYKYCNSVDGLCTAGCNGYSDPPYCTKGCMKGYYGLNCVSHCSSQCPDGECDPNDGACGISTAVETEDFNATDENVTKTGTTEEDFSFNATNFSIGLAACAGLVLIVVTVAILVKRNVMRGKKNIHNDQNIQNRVSNTRTTNVVRYVPPPLKNTRHEIPSRVTETERTAPEDTPESYYEEVSVVSSCSAAYEYEVTRTEYNNLKSIMQHM